MIKNHCQSNVINSINFVSGIYQFKESKFFINGLKLEVKKSNNLIDYVLRVYLDDTNFFDFNLLKVNSNQYLFVYNNNISTLYNDFDNSEFNNFVFTLTFLDDFKTKVQLDVFSLQSNTALSFDVFKNLLVKRCLL